MGNNYALVSFLGWPYWFIVREHSFCGTVQSTIWLNCIRRSTTKLESLHVWYSGIQRIQIVHEWSAHDNPVNLTMNLRFETFHKILVFLHFHSTVDWVLTDIFWKNYTYYISHLEVCYQILFHEFLSTLGPSGYFDDKIFQRSYLFPKLSLLKTKYNSFTWCE